jgi:hypothetical protein
MLTTCWWWCRWRKNCMRGKNDEKSTSSRTLKTCQKWSPARAARNRGAEWHKERLWRDRVRQNLPTSFKEKKKKIAHTRWEWHVECERSDVRGVLRPACAAYSHEWLSHTWGHESRRVRVQRSACGYHKKVREDFFWYEVSWRHAG